jgi:hypothetical protein
MERAGSWATGMINARAAFASLLCGAILLAGCSKNIRVVDESNKPLRDVESISYCGNLGPLPKNHSDADGKLKISDDLLYDVDVISITKDGYGPLSYGSIRSVPAIVILKR